MVVIDLEGLVVGFLVDDAWTAGWFKGKVYDQARAFSERHHGKKIAVSADRQLISRAVNQSMLSHRDKLGKRYFRGGRKAARAYWTACAREQNLLAAQAVRRKIKADEIAASQARERWQAKQQAAITPTPDPQLKQPAFVAKGNQIVDRVDRQLDHFARILVMIFLVVIGILTIFEFLPVILSFLGVLVVHLLIGAIGLFLLGWFVIFLTSMIQK